MYGKAVEFYVNQLVKKNPNQFDYKQYDLQQAYGCYLYYKYSLFRSSNLKNLLIYEFTTNFRW